MVVTADDDICAGFIKLLEERFYGQVIAVDAAGTEERLVPIGEGTCCGMRGEVRAQPFSLRRTGVASSNSLAFAVQRDDVPFSEFVAVVAGLRVSRRHAEIVKVGRCSGRMKFVIAWSGPGAGFDAAP